MTSINTNTAFHQVTDIVINILSYLNERQRQQASSVCQQWNVASQYIDFLYLGRWWQPFSRNIGDYNIVSTRINAIEGRLLACFNNSRLFSIPCGRFDGTSGLCSLQEKIESDHYTVQAVGLQSTPKRGTILPLRPSTYDDTFCFALNETDTDGKTIAKLIWVDGTNDRLLIDLTLSSYPTTSPAQSSNYTAIGCGNKITLISKFSQAIDLYCENQDPITAIALRENLQGVDLFLIQNNFVRYIHFPQESLTALFDTSGKCSVERKRPATDPSVKIYWNETTLQATYMAVVGEFVVILDTTNQLILINNAFEIEEQDKFPQQIAALYSLGQEHLGVSFSNHGFAIYHISSQGQKNPLVSYQLYDSVAGVAFRSNMIAIADKKGIIAMYHMQKIKSFCVLNFSAILQKECSAEDYLYNIAFTPAMALLMGSMTGKVYAANPNQIVQPIQISAPR